jgi:predicted nucleic acid-binding protein
MTNGDDKRIFLDTNALVFANIEEAPLHEAALTAIQSREHAGIAVWVSRQVLRAYLATLSRPQVFTPPIPAEKLVTQVQSFISRFQVAEDTTQVTERLLALIQQFPTGGK